MLVICIYTQCACVYTWTTRVRVTTKTEIETTVFPVMLISNQYLRLFG